jgi:hypothetical protein
MQVEVGDQALQGAQLHLSFKLPDGLSGGLQALGGGQASLRQLPSTAGSTASAAASAGDPDAACLPNSWDVNDSGDPRH